VVSTPVASLKPGQFFGTSEYRQMPFDLGRERTPANVLDLITNLYDMAHAMFTAHGRLVFLFLLLDVCAGGPATGAAFDVEGNWPVFRRGPANAVAVEGSMLASPDLAFRLWISRILNPRK
jgi:hypothetical protein